MIATFNNKSIPPANILNGQLYQGDFYQVKNWSFDYSSNKTPAKGYNDCLCFVLIRNGHFLFDLGNKSYEMHTGSVVIDKPDYEYSLRPAQGQCSIFNFTDAFYASIIDEYNLRNISFFSNKNILAQSIASTAAIDYLHYQVLQQMSKRGKLAMDIIIIELLKQVIEGIGDQSLDMQLTKTTSKHQLTAIERAKEYINVHFLEDISLLELSKQCYVSPFHLSRLFRNHTGLPPYKYLQEVRLKHAEMLVKNSSLPITDICFSSGFKNSDYFSAAFTKKFKSSPTRYKILANK
jgi:AraC family transcriptional regulator